MAHAKPAVSAAPASAGAASGAQNFYQRFAAAVERFGQRTAVEVQRRDAVDRFTYAELHSLAESAAAFLAERGLAPGDRCIILADNDARWCAAYLGILRLGAVAVPMDTAYKPKQIATLLHDSGARVILTAQKFAGSVREALPLAESHAQVFLLHPGEDAFDVVPFDGSRPAAALSDCPANADDPAVILYSSGTTGDPKGVVLTHANLIAEIDSVFTVIHLDERDSILGVLPLFHALAQMANLLLPFTIGASVVFLESLNTTELLRALQERGISAFCCVPQFFYLIHQRVSQQVAAAGWARRKIFRALMSLNGASRRAGINLGKTLFGRVHAVLGPRMHILVTGGSRFDPKIGADLYKLGLNILQAYGLTETSGAATVMRPNDPNVGSVGQPLPGVEIKIAARDSGPDADASRDGEVLIRGPVLMQGYFNRPDANAQALRDGWLYTGDLGYLDSGGRLYITGRKKEIIVLSSGKNIYPEEIESHYLQSPYLKEMCVMGRALPNEPSAERLYAVVVPDMDVMRERKVLNAKEILRFEIESAGIHLPAHKRVLGYEVWNDELPRTTTRKLKRFEIERRVQEGTAGAASSVEDEAPAEITEEEQVWAAQPQVARALTVIRDAAKNKDAVRAAANIELELGLDSMERVELLTHLEQMFRVEVPDEVAHKIYTVRELVEAVTRDATGDAATTGDTWGRVLADAPADDPVLAGLLQPKPFFSALLFVVMKLVYVAARVLLRLSVTGLENLPRDGAFLLCPNHQSYLDAFLLVAALPRRVLRKMFFVGASEYFATRPRAWLARKINLVPVDPDANLVRAMQASAFGLRHGKTLILFPEGERSIDGTVKKFKKGAPILATHLKAPIVPVAIDGAFDAWPRGRPPQRLARVSLKFGAPMPPPEPLPAGASFAEAEAHYTAAAERLRAGVVELWNSIRAN